MPSTSMMQVIFTVCIALLFTRTASAGALTDVSITLSNQLVSATDVTATVTFTAATALTSYGNIEIGFTPMGFKPTDTSAVQIGTSSGATFFLEMFSWAAFSDTLTISGMKIPTAGVVSFTITGLKNPTSAQLSKNNISVKTKTSSGTDIDTTTSGSLSAITVALPSPTPTIAFSPSIKGSLSSATITFTPTTTGTASIAVRLRTSSFVTGTTLTATVSGGASATSTNSVVASFANGILTVSGFTLNSTPAACTIVVGRLVNTYSSFSAQLMVQSVAGGVATDQESAMVAVTPTDPTVSKVSISLSNEIALATKVNVTIAFKCTTAVSGGNIVVSVPGLATAAAATLSIGSASGVTFAAGATAEIAAVGTPAVNTLTVKGATIGASASVSFTVAGVVNLAAQAASKYIQVKTQTSSAVDVDDSGFDGLIEFPALFKGLGSPVFTLSTYAPRTVVDAVISFTPDTSVNNGFLEIELQKFSPNGYQMLTNVTGVTASWSTLYDNGGKSIGALVTLNGITTTAGTRYYMLVKNLSTPEATAASIVSMKLKLDKDTKEVGYVNLSAIAVPPSSAAPAFNQGLSYVATAGAAVAALLL